MRKTESVLPMTLFVDLDKSGPVPLYHQVSQKIEDAILSGALPVGARLESEVTFADRLGLSRPTIRRAIQELVDVGLLVRRRGVGTQVVHGQVTRGVELTSLYDDLMQSGKKPTTELLSLEPMAAGSELARQLDVATETQLLYIKRLRKVDGVPVSIMQNWLNLAADELTAHELERFGLYQLLRTLGVSLSVAKQRIGARKALSDEAELLEVERGSALLTMERLTYDNDGRAVEFGRHAYRPDLYSFETTLVNK
jgi:DNA-binding GntR family transcriptional regulator